MRKQNLTTANLCVFIETNPFQKSQAQYRATQSVQLSIATSDTARIITAALKALSVIWRNGYNYKKGGVMLLDLMPASALQQTLFALPDNIASQSRMQVIDALNKKYGKGSVVIGAAGLKHGWSLRREYLSPNYTTNWQELLRV